MSAATTAPSNIIHLSPADGLQPPSMTETMHIYRVPSEHLASVGSADATQFDEFWKRCQDMLLRSYQGLIEHHYPILRGELSHSLVKKKEKKKDGDEDKEDDDDDVEEVYFGVDMSKEKQHDCTVAFQHMHNAWCPNDEDMKTLNCESWDMSRLTTDFVDGEHPTTAMAKVTLTTTTSDEGKGKRGYLIIVTGIHHTLGDLSSHIMFVNHWAEYCGKMATITEADAVPQLRVPPHHDRSLLAFPPSASKATAVSAPPPVCGALLPMPPTPPEIAQMIQSMFSATGVVIRYTKRDIAKFRAAAAKELGEEGKEGREKTILSTNDIITSSAWQCFFRSMEKAGLVTEPMRTGEEPRTFVVPMNVRGRVKTPNELPSNYWGNAVVGAPVRYETLAELLAATPTQAAQHVRQAVKRFSQPQEIEAVMRWESQRGKSRTRGFVTPHMAAQCFTNWCNYPFYEADFGSVLGPNKPQEKKEKKEEDKDAASSNRSNKPLLVSQVNEVAIMNLGYILPVPPCVIEETRERIRASGNDDDGDIPVADFIVGIQPAMVEHFVSDERLVGKFVAVYQRKPGSEDPAKK